MTIARAASPMCYR